MKLVIGNVNTKIEYYENQQFLDWFDKKIHETIDPLDPQRYRKAAYRRHYWDGRINFYDMKNKTFPTGLYPDVVNLIKATQQTYPSLEMTVEDTRKPAIGINQLEDKIVIKDTPKGDLVLDPNDTMYGYQYKAVKFCLDEQRGFVNSATGSGKTVIAEALIQIDLKELDDSEKILFIVHNKIIAYQTKKRFEESLHIPIGFWGDGKKDIQQVTVCLVGTIASGLKKPEDVIKLTSNKDKILRNLVTVYIPYFRGYPNLKYVIKSYINNNKPKYAYEEPLWETFSDMVQPEVTNDDILKWFKAYEEQYQKLLKKKASKTYNKYNKTMDILNATKVVIVDESQHASSNQYQLVMGNLFNARQRIGLSGTIVQSDPVKWGAMKAIMSDKLFKITNKQMIDSGVSAKPYIQFLPINVPTDLDEQVKDLMPANMDENKMALQLYQETYRAGIIENEYRNEIITALLEKLQATDKSTLVVVKSIEHGEILQDMLNKKGIGSDFLRGDLSFDERADVIERIKQGSAKIVFGTTIVNEGMDIPNLKYLVYASAGSSPIEVLQRIGRVLRKAKGKDTTIIYDFMDKMSKVLYSQAEERKKIYKKEEFQLLE